MAITLDNMQAPQLPPNQLQMTALNNQLPVMTTGGNMQAVAVPTMGTGGNLPPLPTAPPTATANPFAPAQVVSDITNQLGSGVSGGAAGTVKNLQNQFTYTPTGTSTGMVEKINQAFQAPELQNATQLTLENLNTILNSNSPYIRNAMRRGLESAASRGLMNSSIASGASTRAAIESSMPILQESMGLTRQREGQDFQALMQSREQAFGVESNREQQEYQKARDAFQAAAQLEGQDRQMAFQAAQNQFNAAMDLTRQREAQAAQLQRDQIQTQAQDWLSSRQFTREYNAQLAMLPIKNAADLTNYISKAAIDNPDLFADANTISGLSNFFTSNFNQVLSQYFPGG